MKIEAPLSPWEDTGIVDEATLANCPTTGKSKGSSIRKPTPFRARKVKVNENSPDVRSFCLERMPLANIANEQTVPTTESATKVQGSPLDLISLTPLAPRYQENNLDTPSEETPTIITGSAKKALRPQPAEVDLLSFGGEVIHDSRDDTIQNLRDRVDFLERELVHSQERGNELEDVKNLVAQIDAEKRDVERLLEAERKARRCLEEEVDALKSAKKENHVSEKEIALQNRVMNLQSMLKMVSMEKDRLAQFSMVERRIELDEARITIQNLHKQLEKHKNAYQNENRQEDVNALMNENDALIRKMRYVTRTLQQSAKELDRIPPLKHLSRELQRWFETTMK